MTWATQRKADPAVVNTPDPLGWVAGRVLAAVADVLTAWPDGEIKVRLERAPELRMIIESTRRHDYVIPLRAPDRLGPAVTGVKKIRGFADLLMKDPRQLEHLPRTPREEILANLNGADAGGRDDPDER